MELQQKTLQWWNETKASERKLQHWLRNQYRGEATASVRIRQFIAAFGHQAPDPRWLTVVETIAQQEETHARWIGELLQSRTGQRPQLEKKKERYWEATLPGISDWHAGCAVAAHAESMRLCRIRAICNDESAPADIRAVFQKILVDERFHEKAFRTFSSQHALDETRDAHEAGQRALGLVS